MTNAACWQTIVTVFSLSAVNHKQIIIPLLMLLAAIYPLLIFFSINHVGPRILALLLLAILLLRMLFLGSLDNKEHYFQFTIIALLCFLTMWWDSDTLLRYYPVLMNISFAFLFYFSLSSDQTLIERFARIGRADYQDHQLNYMRDLTKSWALLLTINGAISYYSACCLSLKQWAIYNGLVAYGLFAVFVGLELLCRRRYKKQHAQHSADN